VKELHLKQIQKEIHSILAVWHKEYKLHQTTDIPEHYPGSQIKASYKRKSTLAAVLS
jgi:hypothetical protein